MASALTQIILRLTASARTLVFPLAYFWFNLLVAHCLRLARPVVLIVLSQSMRCRNLEFKRHLLLRSSAVHLEHRCKSSRALGLMIFTARCSSIFATTGWMRMIGLTIAAGCRNLLCGRTTLAACWAVPFTCRALARAAHPSTAARTGRFFLLLRRAATATAAKPGYTCPFSIIATSSYPPEKTPFGRVSSA